MNNGLIFDIQRFSVNDGPGIRTTVFFKGCGLRCRWCHNPESIASYPQLSYDPMKCDGCGLCAAHVDQRGISIVNGKAVVDFKIHDRSLDLIEVCPRHAFDRIGKDIDMQTLVSEVLKDKDYYETSGGGVTFSGGEALNQWPFIAEAATLLKSQGIQLTLDVSGYDPNRMISQTMNLIDLYLVDYKLTGLERFEAYIGHTFDPEDMLKPLAEAKKDVILRCVMIPGLNDDSIHFEAIADLQKKYPNIIRIDLLPYHKLRKRQEFNLINTREFYEVPTSALKDQWKTHVKTLAIPHVFMDSQEITLT